MLKPAHHHKTSSLNGANTLKFRETRMRRGEGGLLSVSGLSSHPESLFPLMLTSAPLPPSRGKDRPKAQCSGFLWALFFFTVKKWLHEEINWDLLELILPGVLCAETPACALGDRLFFVLSPCGCSPCLHPLLYALWLYFAFGFSILSLCVLFAVLFCFGLT